MEQQILVDPQSPPTPELLKKALGNNYANYDNVMKMLAEYNIVPEWNYYKDGKSWLCKAQYKKKTVLWLSVWEECFKLSFFFTEKTKDGIDSLEIDTTVKEEFKKQKAIGKLIPLILKIKDYTILNDAEEILKYKIS